MSFSKMDKDIELMSDGRMVIDGIIFSTAVIEVLKSTDPSIVGNRDLSLTCTRCRARWVVTITRDEITTIYKRTPPRSSAWTIMQRVPAAKRAVLTWSSGHICMPRGYAAIPANVLETIDRDATKAEQYETLATLMSTLAMKEGV